MEKTQNQAKLFDSNKCNEYFNGGVDENVLNYFFCYAVLPF